MHLAKTAVLILWVFPLYNIIRLFNTSATKSAKRQNGDWGTYWKWVPRRYELLLRLFWRFLAMCFSQLIRPGWRGLHWTFGHILMIKIRGDSSKPLNSAWNILFRNADRTCLNYIWKTYSWLSDYCAIYMCKSSSLPGSGCSDIEQKLLFNVSKPLDVPGQLRGQWISPTMTQRKLAISPGNNASIVLDIDEMIVNIANYLKRVAREDSYY